MNECPKCKSQYNDGDIECKKCGIIFAKFEKFKIKKENLRNEKLIKCTTCGKEISKNATSCPHCGEPISISTNNKPKETIKDSKKSNPSCIVVVGGGFILFCLLLGLFGEFFGLEKSPPNQGITETKDSKWYQGGNLHSASVSQWQEAKYSNKLATAGDWALSQPRIAKIVKNSGTMNTGKFYAKELMKCVDEASAGEGYGNINVSELAASCMILMKW